MKPAPREYFRRLGLIALFLFAFGAAASARDAAFINPGLSVGSSDGDVKVLPKDTIDVGETVLNVAKRTTLFFVNQTNQPVKVEKLTVTGDGNVEAEASNDDCSKQGAIGPLSRCTVEISVTPKSPGPWGVDVLMTHSGAGRIAEAKLNGKTSGSTSNEKKETGLALSTKEVTPVNFGEVAAGSGKAVRSALMVNDSTDPITLYSIDVIEADNGLQRLDQGCAVDMELKPGESCPVTLVWTPADPGQISTDLIIRHSGRLGFAVIPIRGKAVGAAVDAGKADEAGKGKAKPGTMLVENKSGSIPPPPSALDLEKAAKFAPVAASSLNTNTVGPAAASGVLRLIGTVGNRGVFLTADGNTAVSGVGEDFESGGKKVKVVNIGVHSADIIVEGKKKTLDLGAAPELILQSQSLNAEADSSAGSGSKSSPNAPKEVLGPPTSPAQTATPQSSPSTSSMGAGK